MREMGGLAVLEMKERLRFTLLPVTMNRRPPPRLRVEDLGA